MIYAMPAGHLLIVGFGRFRSIDTVINIRMVVTYSHHPHRLEGSAPTSRQWIPRTFSRMDLLNGTGSSLAPQATFLRADGWELLKANNRDLWVWISIFVGIGLSKL